MNVQPDERSHRLTIGRRTVERALSTKLVGVNSSSNHTGYSQEFVCLL